MKNLDWRTTKRIYDTQGHPLLHALTAGGLRPFRTIRWSPEQPVLLSRALFCMELQQLKPIRLLYDDIYSLHDGCGQRDSIYC